MSLFALPEFPPSDTLAEILDDLGMDTHDLMQRKAALILETFGLPQSAQALADPNVRQSDKELIKGNLYKFAGLDQQAKLAANAASAGAGFSINLVINNPGSADASSSLSPVIDGHTVVKVQAQEITPAEPQAPRASFSVPDFVLINNDLKGGL